jgi:hypothetical protein
MLVVLDDSQVKLMSRTPCKGVLVGLAFYLRAIPVA